MILDPAIAKRIRLDESLQPMMVVVVDTEEEFDWFAPFSRDAHGTKNMRELHHAQTVLDRHGAVPLYVVDHPVAGDDWATGWFQETKSERRCEIGAHLHSWVTPPFEEELSDANSYGCNLAPDLERAKIEALTERIETAFGERPAFFRTGRYGAGGAMLKTIKDLGYRCDLSIPPHSSLHADGGPSFYGWNNDPFWYGDDDALLGIPVTTGFSGLASSLGPKSAPLLDSQIAKAFRVPGIFAGLGLLDRSRLTIEGVPSRSLQQLMASLVGAGQRLLNLSYHSSSMLPGATVYARTEIERDGLLACLDETLAYFTNELGGRLVTVSEAESTIRKLENR